MRVTTGVRVESLHPDVCRSSAVFPFHQLGSVGFKCAGLIFHVCEPGGPWRCLARTWACGAASPSPRVWWSACVSLELCSGGLHWSLSSSQRTTSALCASTQQAVTEPRSWVSFSTSHLPPRVAARCPTSLKDSRTGLKLCHDSFFLSVSCLRLQPPRWTVLPGVHHRLLYEQLYDSTQWVPLRPLWYHGDPLLCSVSAAFTLTELTEAPGFDECAYWNNLKETMFSSSYYKELL